MATRKMDVRFRPAFCVALAGLCVLLVTLGQHDVEGAKLAATLVARENAMKKREDLNSVASEETQKRKADLERLQKDIQNLLKSSKEFKKHEVKKRLEEELEEFNPDKLEKEELWRREYQRYMDSQKKKDFWERVGIATGIASVFSTGVAAFAKSNEHRDGAESNPAAVTMMKRAGTAALLAGGGALVSWLMRRHHKKKRKLHNARLSRMQFEARTGMKPAEESVLGPSDDEIFAPKKAGDKEKAD